MSVNEFTRFVQLALKGDETVTLNSRECGPLFNQSVMTQVDELNQDRHGLMTFIEFVEAFCRLADRVIVSYPQKDLE
jgi:hypothetical protein